MKTIHCLISLMVTFSLSTHAKAQGRIPTPDDFEKWGTLSGENLSPDGRWVTFKMKYESGIDTLFLMNVVSLKKFDFPAAATAMFSPNSKSLAVRFPGNRLVVFNLVSHNVKSYSAVIKFDFLKNGALALLRGIPDTGTFHIVDHNAKVLYNAALIDDFSIADGDKVAIVGKGRVSILEKGKSFVRREIFIDTTSVQNGLAWSSSGKSMVFFNKSKSPGSRANVIHYNIINHQLNELAGHSLRFKEKSYDMAANIFSISENDRFVYLTVAETFAKTESETLVEVWDSGTILEYPEEVITNDPGTYPSLLTWDTRSGDLFKIDDGDFVHSRRIPGGKYFLSQSRASMTSQTDELPPADYYITSLDGKQQHLVVSQGSRSARALQVSPSGQFISFFKDGHYFVYDIEKHENINITKALPVNLNDVEFDKAGVNPGYYSPGWSTDSKFLIVYDQFDVWLISSDGVVANKITRGRETNTCFRLVRGKDPLQVENFANLALPSINLASGIVLSAKTYEKASGYYLFTAKQGIQEIAFGNAKFDRLSKAKDSDVYMYTIETHSQPPRLMLWQRSTKQSRPLFQSNKHYSGYLWSQSRLVAYTNKNGTLLQGLLMLPAGYQEGKKYPMIVYIYEKLSGQLHDYKNPALRSPIGFNPTNYLLDGYLVFMPDIKYEVGNPGLSAADCVIKSVESIIRTGIVDENHIGILGHSYGGFEVAYILSQTNLFAAAVTGSGIYDPINFYLSINNYTGRSNGWRFESQQLRMGSSPFSNWDGYVRNSAIANASKINTPLLSWTGKEDQSVNFEQSIAMHLAMRSLKKKHILILFPSQGHILTDPVAKLRITSNIKDWFDQYLKNY